MPDHIPRRSAKSALESQARVVLALILREMLSRFGSSRIGYFWLIGEPAMLALGVSAIHWVSGHNVGHDIPIFLFYGLSYIPFFMFRSIFTRNSGAAIGSVPLLYHRTIKLHDICMAKTILEFTVILPLVAIFVFFGFFVADVWPSNPGLMVLALVLSAFLSHGIGCLIGALVVFYEPLERITHPLTYLMMPFSGAFYMVDSMTPEVRAVFLWIPLVHIHEAFRDGMWGDKIVSHYNLFYIFVWAISLNLLGISALRACRYKLSLSNH